MNQQKVHEMLLKYFDGATNLKEEDDLQRYFASENIDDSLAAYRPMFTFFAAERAIKPPASNTQARKIRLNLSIITAIAAGIAILLWFGLGERRYDDYIYFVNGQRIYDEKAAIALAENKLQLLATSMQSARNSMAAFDKLQESNLSLQQFNTISNAFKQMEEVGSKIEELKIENF